MITSSLLDHPHTMRRCPLCRTLYRIHPWMGSPRWCWLICPPCRMDYAFRRLAPWR